VSFFWCIRDADRNLTAALQDVTVSVCLSVSPHRAALPRGSCILLLNRKVVIVFVETPTAIRDGHCTIYNTLHYIILFCVII
jgi:hypothetical protein